MDTKVCIKCENAKIVSELTFRKDIQNYRNVCRKCNRERDLKILNIKNLRIMNGFLQLN